MFTDALLRFFGLHKDEDERRLWRARQEYHLNRRILPAPKWLQPSLTRQSADNVFGEQEMVQVDGGEATVATPDDAQLPARGRRRSSTGRVIDKSKEPEHRLRPAMPSVISMVVSGVRTLFKVSDYVFGKYLVPVWCGVAKFFVKLISVVTCTAVSVVTCSVVTCTLCGHV